jgi:hypothetical protein
MENNAIRIEIGNGCGAKIFFNNKLHLFLKYSGIISSIHAYKFVEEKITISEDVTGTIKHKEKISYHIDIVHGGQEIPLSYSRKKDWEAMIEILNGIT